MNAMKNAVKVSFVESHVYMADTFLEAPELALAGAGFNCRKESKEVNHAYNICELEKQAVRKITNQIHIKNSLGLRTSEEWYKQQMKKDLLTSGNFMKFCVSSSSFTWGLNAASISYSLSHSIPRNQE